MKSLGNFITIRLGSKRHWLACGAAVFESSIHPSKELNQAAMCIDSSEPSSISIENNAVISLISGIRKLNNADGLLVEAYFAANDAINNYDSTYK